MVPSIRNGPNTIFSERSACFLLPSPFSINSNRGSPNLVVGFTQTLNHTSGSPYFIIMRRSREERIRGLIKLKLLITKLRRGLFASESQRPHLNDVDDGETVVPNDVKEGYFAVVAAKGGEPKRFVVELECLSNPAFLSLLEQAKEEYGFQQKGVLAVPCPPEELQNVLQCKKNRRISTEW